MSRPVSCLDTFDLLSKKHIILNHGELSGKLFSTCINTQDEFLILGLESLSCKFFQVMQ